MSEIISVAKTVFLPSISISRKNIFWPFFVDKSIDIFLANGTRICFLSWYICTFFFALILSLRRRGIEISSLLF